MQLASGTLLHGGTYKIDKVLGQGSFGITYLAEHTSLGKKVAIKEFFMKDINTRLDDGSITGITDGSLSHNYAQKFRKEAMNLARIEHLNIVRVTDSFDENGTFYYVMDYIDGQNLNDYLKQYAVSEKVAVDIIKDVANALIYMHEEKHMLHLDLKPGNIMRRASDGHIFLIDFGLSKHFDVNGAPETSTTIGLGTAGYAPVEQANQAKNGEFRPTIDVYALGATLYKLLTRETPPAASELVSDDELIMQALRAKGVSAQLVSVVEKAMMPSVKKRTQSVRAFVDSLPSVGNATSTSTTSTSNVTSEETEYQSTEKTCEETVVERNSVEKHPDFEESTYVIEAKYKNYPTSTYTKANEGDLDAIIAYGMMALRGKGINQDSDTAYEWFMLAKKKCDDRGEKLIEQWYLLKDKYTTKPQSESAVQNDVSIGIQHENRTGLYVSIIAVVILLAFCIKGCRDKQVEAFEQEMIESLAASATDWYLDDSNQVYCIINDQKHYIDFYGIPDGTRTLHYAANDSENRKTYYGEFKNGVRADGTLEWKNGDKYTGSFYHGKLFQGTYTVYSDGSYFTGMFVGSQPYNGNWYDKNGRKLQNVYNGK